MSAKQPSATRLIVTLATVGLLSGLVLSVIFLATAPAIERNRVAALNAAIFRVLPGISETTTYVVRDEALTLYDGSQGAIPTEASVIGGYTADGALVGYAIPADGSGFMDTIKLIYGFDPERRVVVGMEVLESRETPGLGDKIITDESFLANFKALVVEPTIVPVKKGEKAAPNDVDCITGATISSKAVVTILNRSSERWLPLLGQAAPARTTDGD